MLADQTPLIDNYIFETMLFNSYPFLLGFLPVAFTIFLILVKWTPNHPEYRLAWLLTASLYFYAYWDPALLPLLICSIVINYGIGRALDSSHRRLAVAIGISFNIGLLGYFKYAGFILENLTYFTKATPAFLGVSLPLAISFFTFHQIAYLVDTYRGRAPERSILRYATFVAFFPQFIAGPITKAHEIFPQLRAPARLDAGVIAVGVTMFTIGLGKKVLLADQLARFADPVFTAADSGTTLTLLDAWGGALAFAFQIYFDFSGYSDMAIGLGLLFGVRLPVNFDSPYQATSLIEFWRRWHITLSRFLLQYLYIPFGGNRHGAAQQYASILVVMLLGGLWHGAGWTFVAWGGIHGVGLIINHLWRRWDSRPNLPSRLDWGLTFAFVVVVWIFFRAKTWSGAVAMLAALGGLEGVVIPETYLTWMGPVGMFLASIGVRFEIMLLFLGAKQIGIIAACIAIVLAMPNTQTWVGYRGVSGTDAPRAGTIVGLVAWRASAFWATAMAAMLLICLTLVAQTDRFIYFQF